LTATASPAQHTVRQPSKKSKGGFLLLFSLGVRGIEQAK
jgi:hypothetical protein